MGVALEFQMYEVIQTLNTLEPLDEAQMEGQDMEVDLGDGIPKKRAGSGIKLEDLVSELSSLKMHYPSKWLPRAL